MTVLFHNLDCLAITKTWLGTDTDKVVIREFVPDGYQFNSVPHQSGWTGGGMGVLLKQGVKASITGCTTEHEYKHFEHMNCNIMIECGKNILLCVVYHPLPSSSKGLRTSNFFSEWLTYLESLDKVLGEIVMVGDINFHLNNKSNPDTKAFLSLLEAHGLM